MDKLRAAAWTAIHKINRSTGFDEASDKLLMEAATVLRKALDHSGEATEMVIDWEAIDKEQLRRYKEKFGDFEQAEQEPVGDNARDNMLLRMIQHHFPSLPVSDEYTDWSRWLRFANAVFEAGRKDAANVEQEPVAYLSDLSDPQPHAVTDLKYCSWAQHERGDHLKYVPVYAAPVQQVTRADLKAAFKEGFERAADIYAPKDGQEPVYWEVRNGVCNHGIYRKKEQAEEVRFDMQKSHDLSGSLASFNIRPLYTAPQPVSQEPVCECRRKTDAVISSEKEL